MVDREVDRVVGVVDREVAVVVADREVVDVVGVDKVLAKAAPSP